MVRSKTYWGTSSNAFGVVAFTQKTMDTSNGELKTSSGRPTLGLSLGFSSCKDGDVLNEKI